MWINIYEEFIETMRELIWEYPEISSKEFNSDSIFIENIQISDEWTRFEIKDTGITLSYIVKDKCIFMQFLEDAYLICIVDGELA